MQRKSQILLLTSLFLAVDVLSQPTRLIFDTDMESDVDDVGALAMLHGLADEGAAQILGTITCSLNPWAAPTIKAVNAFCGRPDIPIGGVKTFGVYRNSKYAQAISEEFAPNYGLGEKVPDATKLYRQLLNQEEDSSVVIVTVGYLTNLSYLLNSVPDEVSPLTGIELVQKKVKHLVCMGGRYPYQNNPGKWGNFKPDPAAIVQVASEWPTSIIFTGGGDFADLFETGSRTFDYPAGTNPISRAYSIFLKSWGRTYHHSADLIAVYVAAKGWEEYFKIQSEGYNHIFEDGTLMWRLQPNDPRHFVVNELKDGISAEEVTKTFDDLMEGPIASRVKKK